MALKIIKINKEDYSPIQQSALWEKKAFYIVKNDEYSSDLYIEGELCGQYDDTEVYNEISRINDNLTQTNKTISELNDRVDQFNTDKFYLYKQTTAAKTWTINHNMGKYPSVTVTDSANNTVVGDIFYIDNNSLSITFSGAFSGKAILN